VQASVAVVAVSRVMLLEDQAVLELPLTLLLGLPRDY
jgi:hypothetical protein